MGQLCVSARARRALAIGVLLAAAPAATAAQSDGSLEQLYASQCAGKQDAQACQALIEAMSKAPAAPASPASGKAAELARVWGNYAGLAGTMWKSADGTVRRYSWNVPGEIMRVDVATPTQVGGVTLTRSATDRIDAVDDQGNQSTFTFPRADVAVQEIAGQRRVTSRFLADRIVQIVEGFENGAWRQLETEERRPATAADFETASAAARTAQEQLAAKWGVLPRLVGYWASERLVWNGRWNGDKFLISFFRPGGEEGNWFQFYYDKRGRLQGEQGKPDTLGPTILPDGGVFIDVYDDAIVQRSPDTFEIQNGRMRDGVYVPSERQDPSWNGVFRKLAPAQALAFQQRVRQAKQQKQQQANSGGGGGMFGALMAATGAVLAGGDAGQVLGAASQGAQMADPGGSTAAMLGQAAGAVGAPQIDFQSALTGSVTGGAVGAAGGSYPTKPNLALGSCPGFSEANYRTVALSGGDDVQRKTMCGQAFEYYTMYKRAIAQGYAEADANRTYAAHEGAVANLQSFIGN